MARSASEMAMQLEAELEEHIKEIDRLNKIVDDLEADLGDRQSTIDEQEEYIAELEDFVAFVREHFPDAQKAFDVRERMEKASGTAAAVG